MYLFASYYFPFKWQDLLTIRETHTDKEGVLYSTVSSLFDRSNGFTRHPLADLFIPVSNRLLWEAFYPRSNYGRRLFTHISTTIYSQVLIYTAERQRELGRDRNRANPFVRDMRKYLRTCQMSVHGYPADKSIFHWNLKLGLMKL